MEAITSLKVTCSGFITRLLQVMVSSIGRETVPSLSGSRCDHVDILSIAVIFGPVHLIIKISQGKQFNESEILLVC